MLTPQGAGPSFFPCSGFGNLMGDSAMVIMWPSRDEDGSYASVTLSQRKAPFEVMPEPDPNPPFVATLELGGTSVRRPSGSDLICNVRRARCGPAGHRGASPDSVHTAGTYSSPMQPVVGSFELTIHAAHRRPRRTDCSTSSGRSAARRRDQQTRTWTSRSITSTGLACST